MSCKMLYKIKHRVHGAVYYLEHDWKWRKPAQKRTGTSAGRLFTREQVELVKKKLVNMEVEIEEAGFLDVSLFSLGGGMSKEVSAKLSALDKSNVQELDKFRVRGE